MTGFVHSTVVVLNMPCQHMSAYVNICQHMSAYVSICQHICQHDSLRPSLWSFGLGFCALGSQNIADYVLMF